MNKKLIAAQEATQFIKEKMILGLGTGTTAYYFIEEVGKLISQGMKLQCVATSSATEKHAKSLNIPLLDIEEVDYLDLNVDGADEVDYNCNAIKGGGGALFREKIVASIARDVIWIVDDSKVVDYLGRFPLPVEILPFGYHHTLKALKPFNPVLRKKDGKIVISDNGNYLVDLHLKPGFDVQKVNNQLLQTIGVLETGLFLKMAKKVIVGTDNGAKIIS